MPFRKYVGSGTHPILNDGECRARAARSELEHPGKVWSCPLWCGLYCGHRRLQWLSWKSIGRAVPCRRARKPALALGGRTIRGRSWRSTHEAAAPGAHFGI